MAFNNARIEGEQAATADCTLENFERVLAVSLTGLWLCMKYKIPQMLKQGKGAIVNCASVARLIGLPKIPAYTASKYGVIGLTRVAALEYAQKNLRVKAVCPRAVMTPMLERFAGSAARAEKLFGPQEPIGRVGRPEEIVDAVLWLCSDKSLFVTGHALPWMAVGRRGSFIQRRSLSGLVLIFSLLAYYIGSIVTNGCALISGHL